MKLTSKDIERIKTLRHEGFSGAELAELFQVDQAHISRICRGLRNPEILPELSGTFIGRPRKKRKATCYAKSKEQKAKEAQKKLDKHNARVEKILRKIHERECRIAEMKKNKANNDDE